MKYTDSDAILPILVTDQNGNSTILWVMAFQMDSYFAAEQPSDSYPMPFAQFYYDESSGYLLGMEIYDLDMSQLEDFELNILQDANEETTELPLEQRIAGYFLKRYANYVGGTTAGIRWIGPIWIIMRRWKFPMAMRLLI